MGIKVHYLKCDSGPFYAQRAGMKTFELRKNDRDFKVGDVLILQETLASGEAMALGLADLGYTGQECAVKVCHVMIGPCYGLAEGYAILSTQMM